MRRAQCPGAPYPHGTFPKSGDVKHEIQRYLQDIMNALPRRVQMTNNEYKMPSADEIAAITMQASKMRNQQIIAAFKFLPRAIRRSFNRQR